MPENAELLTKSLELEIKDFDEEHRIVEGFATTGLPDRDGDIVEPSGAEFKLPMPFLWQHRKDQPIGEVIDVQRTAAGLRIKAKIARLDDPSPLKDAIETAWAAIKAKLVRGLSVGFLPLDRPEPISGTRGLRYKRWGWYETSVVTIPSNAGAEIFRVKALEVPNPSSARPPHGAPVKLVSPKPQEGTVNIQEQIKGYEATRAAKAAEMLGIMEKSAAAGETPDKDQTDKYDGLALEVKTIDGHLGRLRELEKLNIEKAAPVAQPPAAPGEQRPAVIVKGAPELAAGVRFARVVKALGVAHKRHRDVELVAKEMYPDDALVQKAAVAAGTTGAGNWAKPLVGDESSVFADFVEFLRPQTILGKFGAGGIPNLRNVPFRVPLIGQTGGGDGYWVGEGKPKPLTKFAFERRTLEPLKVANIAVLTEEVLMSSSPAAETIVRDSLAAALRERLDIDFIDPGKAAVAGISPASITHGISPIASSGNDADAIRADIQALFAGFIAANNPPTTGVIVMSASTALAASLMRNALGQKEFPELSMRGGNLEGLPVIVSEYVQTDDYGAIVVLLNASDIYLADEGGIAVDVSREASLQMDDDPGTQDATTGTGTSVVSLWQTNAVGFRAERMINWARRRPSAVALLEDVLWGQA